MSTQLGDVRGSSAAERRPIERRISDASNDRLDTEDGLDRRLAVSTADQKTYWGLAELVMWIRTRDYQAVAAISELSETEAMVQALFIYRTPLDPRSLSRFWTTNTDADREPVAPPDRIKSARVERGCPDATGHSPGRCAQEASERSTFADGGQTRLE
jgi:hypothetical protein